MLKNGDQIPVIHNKGKKSVFPSKKFSTLFFWKQIVLGAEGPHLEINLGCGSQHWTALGFLSPLLFKVLGSGRWGTSVSSSSKMTFRLQLKV